MANNYLDKTGLQHFWSLLKTKFSNYLTKTEAASTYLGKTAKAESAKTADSASKLVTARNIYLSGGATSSTPTFDGSSNVNISVSELSESYLKWGRIGINGNISPIEAACCDEFGHNKLAFLPAGCIDVEYTTDGGSTWLDYGLTDSQKIALVSTSGPNIYIGKSIAQANKGTLTNENCGNYQCRVTIGTRDKGGVQRVYTSARRVLMNYSSNGAAGGKIKFETRTIGDYLNDIDNWKTIGTYDVSGWSGWNSFPFSASFGGSPTQTAQIAQIRFTLSVLSVNTGYASTAAIIDIRLIGVTNWNYPSEMARAGHLYQVNFEQNATFPAQVTATKFNGSLNGNATNVTGTVAIANGGTGKTNGRDAANVLLNNLETGGSTPVDADYYISQYVNGGTTTTTYHRRPMSALYAYIKGKLDSVYQPKGSYLTSFTETDPTVPSWAKAANKPSYNFNEINNKPTGDYVTGVALSQSAASNNSLYTANSTAKTNLNNFAATITSTNRSDKKYLIFSTGVVQDSHVDTGSVSVELSKDFSDSVCEKGTIKAEVYHNGTMYNAPFYDLEIGTNKNLKLICNNGECYVDITYTLTNAGVLTFSKYDCYRAVQGTTTLQVTTAKIDGSSVATSDIPLDTLDVTVTKTLQAEQDILGNTIHNTYLPLKGGTLSGNLIIGAGSTCIKKAGTTSNLLLYADSGSTSKNAVISLHGSEVGTAPGIIHLRAGDGTTTKSLMLYPNGDIKWNNTNISLEGHTHSQYLTSHQSLSGYVPTTRTINSKALSSNITLSAADVSAVPTTRKVNNKALSADITLSASDVSAVPTTRTVNGKALSANITLSASDVGAAASSHTHDQYKYSTTSTTSYGLPYWEYTNLTNDSTDGFDSFTQIGRYGIVANANTKGLPDVNAITAAAGTIGGILEVDALGAMSGISSYTRCVQRYYKINSVTKGSAWMRVGYYKSDTGWTWGTWEQLIDNELADSSYLASNKLGTIAFDTNSGSKILIKDTAMAKGDTPSGNRYSYITFGGTDVAASNAKILGNFGTVVSSTDTKASIIAFRNIASSTSLGRIDVVAPTDTTKAFYATAPSTPANSTSNEIVTADYISDVVRLSSGGTANATTGIWYSKYSDGTIVGHGRVTVGGTVNAGATKDISVTLPVSASSGTAFSVAATCSHSGMNVGIANTAANKFTAQVRNITTSNINAASVVVHFNFIAH